MIFSGEFLSGMWFEIYKQVVRQNNQLSEGRICDEQLVSVTTTIFIQAGQKGYLKPSPMNSFQQELVKAVASVNDRTLQKSIYNYVKIMINGNNGRELT